MGNEGQQPPLPEQEAQKQQGFYGWQYDQDDDATEVVQHSPSQRPPQVIPRRPSQPLPPVRPPSQPLPPQPPLQQSPAASPPTQAPRYTQAPERYQQPIQDMGTTLGYGQGMEYQYFDVPQPSQPMAQLRQERLQQLREERMRRQQRRMQRDASTLFPWPGTDGQQPEDLATPTRTPHLSPQRGFQGTPPPDMLQQMSPALPPDAVVRSSTVFPPPQMSPTAGANNLQPASAPAADTGMIQKVRVGRAALILTGAFVASRILGLLRSSMFAFVFGTSSTSDAYLQAFLIPDLIFNIVAGGALSSAFIPVFTNYMIAEKDEKTAWHVASSALNLAIAIMLGLALIAIIFARQLVPFYNPGAPPAELDLIASLTRVMLLQSIALGTGVIVTSVLNACEDFRLPAIGTVLYNVGLILGLVPGIILAFGGRHNDQLAVYAATWGVVIGAVLQVGVQIPGLFKVGMRYKPAFDWRHPGVIQIGRQMVPRIVNAAMLYTSTFVDRRLILLLTVVVGQNGVNGLITQYYQATQLVMLPLGIFGSSVATAAFPTMAENVARGRFDRVRNTILETMRSMLFMSIPSSIGLIALGLPILQVLLQHGRFSLSDAQSTAVPLAFFALGLPGLTAVEILTRAFYAMRDSKTPVIISVGQFIFKILFSLVIIDIGVNGAQWGLGALAFATAAAWLLEAAVLLWMLNQHVGGLQLRTLAMFTVRVLVAALAMGIGLIILRFFLDMILVTTRDQALGIGGALLAIVKLLIELFAGLFVYIRGARLLGIEELGPVKRVLDRLKLSWI